MEVLPEVAYRRSEVHSEGAYHGCLVARADAQPEPSGREAVDYLDLLYQCDRMARPRLYYGCAELNVVRDRRGGRQDSHSLTSAAAGREPRAPDSKLV